MAKPSKQARGLEYHQSYKGPKSTCRCGHLGDGSDSQHGGIVGHGACTATGCGCDKFTWKDFTPEYKAGMDKLK